MFEPGVVPQPGRGPGHHPALAEILQRGAAAQQFGLPDPGGVPHCLEGEAGGGPAPGPPEFSAFRATGWAGKKRAERNALPSRLAAGVGARVALQRGPILRTGDDNIS